MRQWRVALSLVAIVVVATAGRWYSASLLFDPSSPVAGRLSGDEVVYLLLGDRLWHEGRYTAQGIEHVLSLDTVARPAYLQAEVFKHPPLFPFLVGLSRAIAGGVLAAGFFPNLVLSAVSLLVLFALGREAGLSPVKSLLPVALLAVSPVHWVCSARIWLDLPVTTFVLCAVYCQIRGVRRSLWFVVAGLLWGCAMLTKYAALPALVGSLVGTVYASPRVVRSRAFWAGYAVTVAMLLPWIAVRWNAEGWSVIAFWTSGVDDWRRLTRVLGNIWLLPLAAIAAALLVVWRRSSGAEAAPRVVSIFDVALVATLAIGVVWLVNPFNWNVVDVPSMYWGSNPLAVSSPHFYLSRQVLFEPICWLGFAALLTAPLCPATAWIPIRATWMCLFLFVTVWGNYQLRYGVVLVPWEHLGAVALLSLPQQGNRSSLFAGVLSAAWLLATFARSLWILYASAAHSNFFYF